ncbi:MAG TPA: DUF4390 domain-containing protein [Polyangiaceae bacterium]|nr:DUF4390 domain-containing protein [Polyangiaceae bacterium]
MTPPGRAGTRGTRARWIRLAFSRLVSAAVFLAALARPGVARADDPTPPRKATFTWDAAKKDLFVSVAFRDGLDEEIQRKLSRGLPTTIVFTGTLYRHGTTAPISTTVQTCKITWHVWDEAYRVDLTRPEGSRTRWTTTLEGVLRRCAEVSRLLVATSKEVSYGTPVYLRARVSVNPVSQEILDKIKLWVSRPARTGTAAPGDALFSTFTGLFMQRVGEAERILELVTFEIVPGLGGAEKNEI